MRIEPGIEALTDDVLLRWYGATTVQRGEAYFRDGRVRLQSGPGDGLKAVVRGSGRNTYVASVSWWLGTDVVELDDWCSCPLGGACKHVVATILTARAARPSSPGPAAWRLALADVVAAGDEGARGATGTPLALEIAVEEPRAHRYGPPTAPQLTVRPLRLGRNGRWVRTGATWRDIGYGYTHSLREIDPDHLATAKALLGGARLASYYSDPASIPLGSFGRDLWFHLGRAAEVGLALVGAGGRDGAVVIEEPGRISVDLRAGVDDGVVLATRLLIADEAVDLGPGPADVLGNPAHGLWFERDGVLHLVPFVDPVPLGVARLAVAPPLDVPADDVDDLFATYQPVLSRLVPVGSSDGSVTIATTELDGLVIAIDRVTADVAEVRWLVRYRRGDRVVDHPLVGFARHRDRSAEHRALRELELPTQLLPGLADPSGTPRDLVVRGADAVTLLADVVPWLESRGQVHVVMRGDAPELREAVDDPLISLAVLDREADDDGRTDWFDLDIQVSVDGQAVPLAHLLAALTAGDELLILPSGTWLRLDRPELDTLRHLVEEARGLVDHDGEGTVAVNAFQVDWWNQLCELGVVREQSARWQRTMARLTTLEAPEPVTPPAGLDATLRPYQQDGLDWLAFLWRSGLGGILADDMGLGKTVQTLALCLHVLDQRPDARFLVVAPTSVVENWHREAARFAPGVEVRAIRETAARRGQALTDTIGGARLVVTSYALFRLEYDAYSKLDWELLLLDEAQFVKNHTGRTYQCVRRLDAATKIAITGTPLENSLMDLWSLLSITAPGLYPDPKRFAEVYRKPIESGRSPELLATLRRRIAPLMRRRTKDAVLTELPPKTETTVEVQLSPRHARIYQTQLQRQRQKVLGLVGDVQHNRFEILKSLTILRQLSLDPALIDEEHEGVGSAKLDRLEEDLVQVVAEGHRALVFSQFTRYLARVRTRLERAGIDHAYLDGRTRKRAEAIERFRSGAVPVFVISLKAGGFGLNLTEADYCFVLDPWWNPAVENQAIDRTHRIGQANPVVVYRYVAEDTIEEKVMELKARKAALFANVMDADGALAGALTEADIRGLLDLE